MDLYTVESYRPARDRRDLSLAPGEHLIAGGTWMFSDPDPQVTGLVDVMTLDWRPWQFFGDRLEIAATCTIEQLARLPRLDDAWRAHPLLEQACDALLASWKIWHLATVGGNVARSLAAGAMISLLSALDARATIWGPDDDRVTPVAHLPTGNGTNSLRPGEVIRSFEIPQRTLESRTSLQKIALSTLGRSGSVVIARHDTDGEFVVTVTAGTTTPRQLRYPQVPSEAELCGDVDALTGYFTDAHGPADWRRGVSVELAARARSEVLA
ncbi:hypothetical protein BHE97_15130 [Aeromicrobium sp. PE09-221]|uniref:FAD binding domain-containing protein n=1 Tax=Aeromicrobium sp. PE09-221 TaxID=1898043 RepID=UPI000B3EAE05|nr:FAD binding domain-containing protein [Aeromicrobium sp. PE09-221]OUZ08060.1 hypothetical protein BHE97_15130 [Aeromicrobium sp. PE09-221]